MSMISAQIDELRELADDIESRYGYPTAVKALRYAADTIWQLRDDLQRANAAVQDAEHDESVAWDRVRKAEVENAKLRELVDALWYCAHEAHGICARVPVGGEKPFMCCPLYDFDTKEYRCKKRMRELRVEVDG